jgi:hypothetical protein
MSRAEKRAMIDPSHKESTKNRGRLGSLDRCGADLLAKSLGNIGALERAGGPAAGASPTVLGALIAKRERFYPEKHREIR